MVIKCGMQAPDFELESQLGDQVRLSEYRGRHNVLLAFFPMAWTPV
jgi:peroxiredoxin